LQRVHKLFEHNARYEGGIFKIVSHFLFLGR
jgi:hypothetical protein